MNFNFIKSFLVFVCFNCTMIFATDTYEILITEFMAINDNSLTNKSGKTYDWIEIYNPGTNEVNLEGWFLTDDALFLPKWKFPATNIIAKSYIIIFASDKDKRISGKELHTNFKLSGAGEFLAIIKPDSNTFSHSYSPHYPQQIADVSCGLPAASTYSELLITSDAPCKAIVPIDSSLGLLWTEKLFDDSSWLAGTTGVGYDNNSTYLSLIGLDLKSKMYEINPSCYIRIPFFLENIENLSSLTLRMKFDDGFVAYINGNEVESANAPSGTLTWNSKATQIHDDSEATTFVDYNLQTGKSGAKVSIENGTNYFAIHGLNLPSTSSDALFLPELSAVFSSDYITNTITYFFTPTPGYANSVGISNLPPIINFVGHSPLVPEDSETIIVTAKITETTIPIGNVSIHYRVMYGSEIIVAMTDIGDGIFSGNIPETASNPGQMLRYYITAADTNGNSLRWPLFAAPTDTEYFGTVINDSSIITNIPVYHWFVQNSSAADTRSGTRCSFFFNTEFYDNIFCRLRGGSSSFQTKKPHKFEFNADHEFKFYGEYKRADEINIMAAYNDTSYLRDFLAWEILKNSKLPYCFTEIVQMRQNGGFYALEVCVEQIDGHFLRRQNIDDNGSLYKSPHPGTALTDIATSVENLEKKRPKDGNFTDITNLVTGLTLPTQAQRKSYMLDNINVPEAVNYLAAHRIFMEFDFGVKNFYLYNNSVERGEWSIFAWDKDLTFGMIWDGTNVFGDETHDSSPYTGVPTMFWCEGNAYYNGIIYNFPQMYARRIRTLMDKILQPPETLRGNLKLENRVYELKNKIKTLADLDRAKWGWPTQSSFYNRTDHLDIDEGCTELTNDFISQRRTYMYVTRNVDNGGIIPHSQPETANLIFGNIKEIPSSGILNEQYFELINTNNYTVDISCWQVSNAVTFSFFGGTVVPAGKKVYVSPSVKAFRNRSISPKSGENNFVVGNYSGLLEANSETIFLLDCRGNIVASANTIPEPVLFINCYLLFIIFYLKRSYGKK